MAKSKPDQPKGGKHSGSTAPRPPGPAAAAAAAAAAPGAAPGPAAAGPDTSGTSKSEQEVKKSLPPVTHEATRTDKEVSLEGLVLVLLSVSERVIAEFGDRVKGGNWSAFVAAVRKVRKVVNGEE